MTDDKLIITADDVRIAAAAIEGAVQHTPTNKSLTISKITGANVYLKFESFQFTAAYKERGALNRLLHLTDDEKKAGVIAMSAGNHAQGVSYHAARMGIPATIVMPAGTPFNKVKRTEELGAEVILQPGKLEDATEKANELAIKHGYTFIHPFNDPLVMAGQGTVGLEMLTDVPSLDTLIIPIGGGGLISGIAVIAKEMNPDIRIVGVQTEAFPSMKEAMEGEKYEQSNLTIAEGIAVLAPGENAQPIVKKYVDEIVVVPETRIEEAIVLLMEVEKVIVEGAGATGLAAMMEYPHKFEGHNVGLVLTGGNIDSRLLASAIMRGMARDGRLCRLRVTMLDQPGSLARVAEAVASVGANVLELRHQREFGAVSLKMTEMEMVIEAKDKDHSDMVVKRLEEQGFVVAEAKTV